MILRKDTISNTKYANTINDYILNYNPTNESAFIICLSRIVEMNELLSLLDTKNASAVLNEENSINSYKADIIRNTYKNIKKSIDVYMHKINEMFMSDDKYVTSNKDILKSFNEEDTFKIKGYEYTITPTDTNHLNDIFINLADKVETVYKDCINVRDAKKLLEAFQKFYDNNITATTEEYVRELRSYILNKNHNGKYIDQKRFINESNKKFRGGTITESNITIDKSYIDCLMKHYLDDCVGKLYKSIDKDTHACQESLDRILFYLDAIQLRGNKINNFNNPTNANLNVAIESFCNKIYNSMIVTLTEETNMYVSIECDAIYEMAFFYNTIMKKAIDKKKND